MNNSLDDKIEPILDNHIDYVKSRDTWVSLKSDIKALVTEEVKEALDKVRKRIDSLPVAAFERPLSYKERKASALQEVEEVAKEYSNDR